MQFIAIRVLFKRIGALFSMMRDKTVPLRKKALVVFGVVYLFLPVDIIPPILFPFGFIDDIIIWAYILTSLKDLLDTYWMGDKNADLSKKFRDKYFVENVEFETEEDGEAKKEEKEN